MLRSSGFESSSVADTGMFIPDSGSKFFPSRIRIKELSILDPKKRFLSSRKYNPVDIPDPDPEFFTHPGSRIRNTGILTSLRINTLSIFGNENRL